MHRKFAAASAIKYMVYIDEGGLKSEVTANDFIFML